MRGFRLSARSLHVVFFIVPVLLSTAPSAAQDAILHEWTYHGLAGPNLRDLKLHDGNLYASSDSGLFVKRADDFDTTGWAPLGFEGQPVWAFDVLSADTHVAVVLEDADRETQQQLYRTVDGGETWAPIAVHLRQDAPEERFGFIRHLPDRPQTLFAGGHGVLARSDDGGESWRPVFGSWDALGMGVHFVAFDPLRPDIMWSGGESTIFWPFLLKSEDGGESWQEVPIFLGGDNAVYSMAIDSVNPDIQYIGVEGSVLKSTDGGESWNTILAPDTYEYFFGLAVSQLDSDRLYATGMRNALEQKLTLYISEDAGATWTVVTHGEESLWLGVEHLALQSGVAGDTLYLGTRYDGIFAYSVAVPTGSENKEPVSAHQLEQNVPNPFNHSTSIPFTLSATTHVRLTIYDAVGREVVRLVDGVLPAGKHAVEWVAQGHPSAMYLYRMQMDGATVVRRMSLVR